MVAKVLTSFSFCLSTVRVLFGLSHRHLGDVLAHLFWRGVLTLKFLVSMNGARAMYQTTTSSQMATPRHQPVDEIATFAFSPRWDMSTVQLLVMWGTAFFVYFTDTQLWAVLAYSQFCVAVAVKQRFKHPRSDRHGGHLRENPNPFLGRQDPLSWPNLWDTDVQFMRHEDKIDDEMFKSMVYYKRETKVR